MASINGIYSSYSLINIVLLARRHTLNGRTSLDSNEHIPYCPGIYLPINLLTGIERLLGKCISKKISSNLKDFSTCQSCSYSIITHLLSVYLPPSVLQGLGLFHKCVVSSVSRLLVRQLFVAVALRMK